MPSGAGEISYKRTFERAADNLSVCLQSDSDGLWWQFKKVAG